MFRIIAIFSVALFIFLESPVLARSNFLSEANEIYPCNVYISEEGFLVWRSNGFEQKTYATESGGRTEFRNYVTVYDRKLNIAIVLNQSVKAPKKTIRNGELYSDAMPCLSEENFRGIYFLYLMDENLKNQLSYFFDNISHLKEFNVLFREKRNMERAKAVQEELLSKWPTTGGGKTYFFRACIYFGVDGGSGPVAHPRPGKEWIDLGKDPRAAARIEKAGISRMPYNDTGFRLPPDMAIDKAISFLQNLREIIDKKIDVIDFSIKCTGGFRDGYFLRIFADKEEKNWALLTVSAKPLKRQNDDQEILFVKLHDGQVIHVEPVWVLQSYECTRQEWGFRVTGNNGYLPRNSRLSKATVSLSNPLGAYVIDKEKISAIVKKLNIPDALKREIKVETDEKDKFEREFWR